MVFSSFPLLLAPFGTQLVGESLLNRTTQNLTPYSMWIWASWRTNPTPVNNLFSFSNPSSTFLFPFLLKLSDVLVTAQPTCAFSSTLAPLPLFLKLYPLLCSCLLLHGWPLCWLNSPSLLFLLPQVAAKDSSLPALEFFSFFSNSKNIVLELLCETVLQLRLRTPRADPMSLAPFAQAPESNKYFACQTPRLSLQALS